VTKFVVWLVLIAILAVAVLGAWWWFDLRWRPQTVTKKQVEIVNILEQSGFVSPGLGGPKLYMIGFRSCPDCIRYVEEEFPKLHEAGVDTRVIYLARDDLNGAEKSTPIERTTVAELAFTHDWGLFERWTASPLEAWTAQGIPPADGDQIRTAVIEARRKTINDLRPLLKANGVEVGENGLRYPTLIWWTKDGEMKACACEKPETYRYVRSDLGAK
jgi:hypothetical protein